MGCSVQQCQPTLSPVRDQPYREQDIRPRHHVASWQPLPDTNNLRAISQTFDFSIKPPTQEKPSGFALHWEPGVWEGGWCSRGLRLS